MSGSGRRWAPIEEGCGLIFRSQDKDLNNPQHEKWADYEGRCKIDGNVYFMNAWIRTSGKTGKKFLSVTFKRLERQPPRYDDAEATRA